MSGSEHVHSKLLRESARAHLGPLGLTQKGRSRIWLDDQCWWLCVVEFQPSGFSRGSYLNVGCMWLWQEKDYFSFDEGDRVGNLHTFENPDQFRVVATTLAAEAAAKVERYRSMFQTVREVSDYYLDHKPTNFWPSFHAAVACGLVGRVLEANRFFAQVLHLGDDNVEWVKAGQIRAAHWMSIVHDTELFRQNVRDAVNRTRKMLKLSEKNVSF